MKKKLTKRDWKKIENCLKNKKEFVICKKPIPLILEYDDCGFTLWTEEKGTRHWLIDGSMIALTGLFAISRNNLDVWKISVERANPHKKHGNIVFRIIKKRGKKK